MSICSHRLQRGVDLIGLPLQLRTIALLAGAMAVLSTILSGGGCQSSQAGRPPTFRQVMDRAMPHLGEGNVVVIADAAFPSMSHSGVTTVPMAVGSIEALQEVLASASAHGHIAPRIWVDRELFQVGDAHAPGVAAFRSRLLETAGDVPIDSSLTRDDLRGRLREVAQTHRVVVIKTPNRLPFSTIYVEFDHGNWTAAQDEALRTQMAR